MPLVLTDHAKTNDLPSQLSHQGSPAWKWIICKGNEKRVVMAAPSPRPPIE